MGLNAFKLFGKTNPRVLLGGLCLGKMVRLAGLEPVTPTMSRWCSNQLSYSRVKDVADDKQF